MAIETNLQKYVRTHEGKTHTKAGHHKEPQCEQWKNSPFDTKSQHTGKYLYKLPAKEFVNALGQKIKIPNAYLCEKCLPEIYAIRCQYNPELPPTIDPETLDTFPPRSRGQMKKKAPPPPPAEIPDSLSHIPTLPYSGSLRIPAARENPSGTAKAEDSAYVKSGSLGGDLHETI